MTIWVYNIYPVKTFSAEAFWDKTFLSWVQKRNINAYFKYQSKALLVCSFAADDDVHHEMNHKKLWKDLVVIISTFQIWEPLALFLTENL